MLDRDGRSSLADNVLSLLKQKFPHVAQVTVSSFWPLPPFLKPGLAYKKCVFEQSKEMCHTLPATVQSLTISRRPTLTEMRAILKQCPSLQEFTLDLTSTPNANLETLLPVIAKCTTLKSLTLIRGVINATIEDKNLFSPSLVNVRFADITANEAALQHLSTSCSKLEVLDLNRIDLGILNTFLPRCSTLKQLTLRGTEAPLEQINFPQSLERLIIIRTKYMDNRNVTGLRHLFASCPRLKSFNFQYQYQDSTGRIETDRLALFWDDLAQLPANPSLEQLIPLHRGFDQALTAAHVQAFGRTFPNVKKLDVNDVWRFIVYSFHLGTFEEVVLDRQSNLNSHFIKLILEKLFREGVSVRKITFTSFDKDILTTLSNIAPPALLECIHFSCNLNDESKKQIRDTLQSLPTYHNIAIRID